jgi:YggT family protein
VPFGSSIPLLVSKLITVYMYLIIVYVLMSWFPIRGGVLLDLYRVLGSICEPFIGLFRRILPQAAVGGAGLDFSPLVAILVLQIAGQLVVRILISAGL